jgi:predicted Zn-dependent protease with MMP-like domain/Flp pilus assembly protein TadD
MTDDEARQDEATGETPDEPESPESDEGEPGDPRVEAAWRFVDEGNVAAARRAVAQLPQDSPDVLLLLAACCREEDEPDRALALLAQAAAADPQWAVPELWQAEILASHPDQLEEALSHARRALDLAEDESDYLSAVTLKAGIELELGQAAEARKTLAELPPPEVPVEDLPLALEIADLHLALGDPEAARARMRTLTAAHPESADAWHALGSAAAELEDEAEMRSAWKRAWTLDVTPDAAQADGDRLSEDEVGAVAEAALEELPARARQLLQGIPIVIAEQPAEADVDAGLDPRALGLFSGTAYPDNSSLDGQPGLTQIVLFRRNLERVAGDEDELREEIRITLLHETGHFFGLEDADLEELGLD